MNFRAVEHDEWVRADAPTPGPHRLLTLAQWRDVAAEWPRAWPIGLALDNDVDVREVELDVGRIALIELHFPKWTDGRAYSQARLLRVRRGWRGALRAAGDVVVDMAPQLARTGFDAALLRPGQDPREAARILRLFGDKLPVAQPYYQGDVLEPRPRFRRVAGVA